MVTVNCWRVAIMGADAQIFDINYENRDWHNSRTIPVCDLPEWAGRSIAMLDLIVDDIEHPETLAGVGTVFKDIGIYYLDYKGG